MTITEPSKYIEIDCFDDDIVTNTPSLKLFDQVGSQSNGYSTTNTNNNFIGCDIILMMGTASS